MWREVFRAELHAVQPLFGHVFVQRLHAAERLRALELLHEVVDVFRAAPEHRHVHDRLPLVDLGAHRREHHVLRHRLLDQVEELRPGKRPPIDQRVCFLRAGNHLVEFLLVDAAANPDRLLAEPRGGVFVAADIHGKRRVARRQRDHADGVEDREKDDEEGKDPDEDVRGALVVERARGEVAANHAATSRNSTPSGAARLSSSSGAAAIRSRSAAAPRGSIGSMATPRRASRLRRRSPAGNEDSPETMIRAIGPPPSRSSWYIAVWWTRSSTGSSAAVALLRKKIRCSPRTSPMLASCGVTCTSIQSPGIAPDASTALIWLD